MYQYNPLLEGKLGKSINMQQFIEWFPNQIPTNKNINNYHRFFPKKLSKQVFDDFDIMRISNSRYERDKAARYLKNILNRKGLSKAKQYQNLKSKYYNKLASKDWVKNATDEL